MAIETELKASAVAMMEKDSWEEAARLLSGQHEIVARSYELSWNLGWCCLKLFQFGQAVANLQRAVEIDLESRAGTGRSPPLW